MSLLFNLLAVLACLAAVTAFVLVGLRLAIPAEPYAAPEPPLPRRRWIERLRNGALILGSFAVLSLSTTVQAAYGAPLGDQVDGEPITVLEVGECDRPWSAFGLLRRCELAGYASSDPMMDWRDAPVVASRSVLEPGDEVARYEVSGWREFVQVFPQEPKWRLVAEEDRPDLTWLPAGTLAALGVLASAGAKLARRAREARSVSDRAASRSR